MKDKYGALLGNNTWTLTTLPPNRHAIGYKWVFHFKQNLDGSILKYKPRLVAKGFHQQQWFDFTKTFSLAVKPITVRTILTIAVSRHWHITQLDMNNVFFNGILQEVYIQQPPGFVSSDKHLVWILNKAIYGLKQAPRAWFDWLNLALHGFGFVSNKCDPSLFISITPTHTIFMLVYVDDIIVTSN